MKPKEETKVKEVVKDGIPKICFSIIPVKKCPNGSRPDGESNLLVPYHCVRSTSPVVKKYREAVKTRILDETMGKSPDTYSKSVIPKRCIPA